MTRLFDEIPGQERVREILARAVESPADSYLFIGPRGVGKTKAAKLFSAAILCPDRCGKCAICSRVIRGIHPDVQIFQPEGYVYPVDLIRELVSAARLTPLEASRRVMIIEEADRIVERSQNALLKALEEPTQAVTWILVADALEPFLPTILSRCQIVEFVAVDEASVQALVASSFDLPEDDSSLIVRAARGDLEKALALASGGPAADLRGLANDAGVMLDENPSEAATFSVRLQEVADAVKQSMAEDQKVEAESWSEVIGSGRSGAAIKKRLTERHRRMTRRAETDVYLDFLGYLGTTLRDLSAVSAGADPETLISTDHAEAIVGAAGRRPTAEWLSLIDECLAAQLAIVENANAPLAVEAVLLGLTQTRVVTIERSQAGVAQR